ncbi:MAG: UvrD-helicase domain-containing protein [Exilibacterium sp.]
MSAPADQSARLQALSPTDSFAVAAPAGSGKTGLLTQRVLQLLAYCQQPEEILCITFTRKAAAEMQHRITRAITDAADSGNESLEPSATSNFHDQKTRELALAVLRRDREQGWNLLLAPNRLRIQTIDGLCRNLVRQMPLASGLGSLPDPLEQPRFAYRQAIRETLQLLERDSPLQRDLSLLLRHLDNHLESVELLLADLLAKRDQWLGPLLATREARHYLEQVLETLIVETLEDCASLLQPWSSDLALAADYAAANLAAQGADSALCHCAGMSGLPPCEESGYRQWEGLLELLLTQKHEWRSKLDKRNGFPAGANKAEKARAKQRKDQILALIGELREVEGLREQLQLVRRLPCARYSDSQWQLLDSLTRLLPVLVAQLKLVFGQMAATDFIEITQAALQALGQEDAPSDLALKLDHQIRHILVDEFQDTASPQLQLLEKLTAGWQPGDGRTLFIVGDGMQSCYGFRNANVGIFLDARQHGIGDLPLRALDLQVNFRSHHGVVEWTNRVFKEAFPKRDDINRGAVKYAASGAFKPATEQRPVAVIGCLDAAGRDPEAEQVVQLVQSHQSRDPAGSIAILVRNRSHLSNILNALKSAGIAWQATDIDPLASRMAVIDIMSLTRALLDPGDRIAWLSLLRAPWCGLDMHDLYYLVNTDLGEINPRSRHSDYPLLWPQIYHSERIESISAAGQRSLERLRRVLGNAWQQRRRKPLRYWLEGIWLELGGPAALVDSIDIENIPRYFELLQSYERGGIVPDWEAFEQAVAQLYAVAQTDAAGAVQVMTIHKSKGLEFDTVIIPGLDRLPRQDQSQLLLWQEQITRDGDKQLLLGPLSATGDDCDRLYRYLREERRLRGQFEANRLLYVGCTRAIKHLYLLANLQSDQDDKVKAPPPQSLLACIWKAVENDIELIRDTPNTETYRDIHRDTQGHIQGELFSEPASEPATVNPRTAARSHILRLPPEWKAPPLHPDTTLRHYRGHEFNDDENRPSADYFTNRIARHTGTVIHRALQRIASDGLTLWTPQRLSAQRPFWQQQLRQLGVFGAALGDCVDKVQQAVANTLADATGRWILDNRHPQSACEMALWETLPQQQKFTEIRASVIDRTFVHDNCRWIIDYKSSEPKADQPLQAFCHQQAQTYTPQLQRYARLFQKRYPEPVRTGLYFPLLQTFHEVVLDKISQ